MKKIFNILLLASIALFLARACFAASAERRLIYFYSPSCHKCAEVKLNLIPQIEEEFKGRLNIEYRDISDIENYKLLLGFQDKYKIKASNSPPIFYVEGQFLNVDNSVNGALRVLLAKAPKDAISPDRVDLVSRFKGFSALAIASAGLIDGFNPCAFTVIVFFISFLALQGYRKRQLAAIGVTFIFAVFLTYVLIGIGLFSFLYKFQGFSLAVRVFNYCVGGLSIILGAICVYDLIKFKKTKNPEGMILQLPQSVKNQIHKVIGAHYRVNKKEAGAERVNTLRLLLSALIAGFLVSILEAVCTGQMYLPTIAFVLKSTDLKVHAAGYLLLYNIMFVAPLFGVFILALMGASSEQFAGALRKHMPLVKILMAMMFVALGIFLLWR
ncbi:MAG: cytochrome c biogenesis protein CcdA [Candidatus Omnitrophota bacterium]